MKDLFLEIIELDKLNPRGSFSTHMAKLMEETGEMASEANKLSGLKKNKKNESLDQIKQNLSDEAADSIQNIIAICGKAGVTYEQLMASLAKSNVAWKETYLVKTDETTN